MGVYVDEMREVARNANWRFATACHMAADTLTELHGMARAIGLRRSWFQDTPGQPHYDLTERKRELALKKGARAVDTKELVKVNLRASERESDVVSGIQQEIET